MTANELKIDLGDRSKNDIEKIVIRFADGTEGQVFQCSCPTEDPIILIADDYDDCVRKYPCRNNFPPACYPYPVKPEEPK